MCEDVCFYGKSTIKVAFDNAVPLKTFEKWITAFNKDNHCFDNSPTSNDFHIITPIKRESPYDNLSEKELRIQLMNKDIEIARLKKGYIVKEGGTGRKEFVTFSKKNTK